jgi:hypothetical protein
MMTEEEWKAFEKHRENIVDPQPDQTKFYHSVLLAHKELKERREDEEWLKSYLISLFHDDEWNLEYISGTPTNKPGVLNDSAYATGPTLHAAVSAARGK